MVLAQKALWFSKIHFRKITTHIILCAEQKSIENYEFPFRCLPRWQQRRKINLCLHETVRIILRALSSHLQCITCTSSVADCSPENLTCVRSIYFCIAYNIPFHLIAFFARCCGGDVPQSGICRKKNFMLVALIRSRNSLSLSVASVGLISKFLPSSLNVRIKFLSSQPSQHPLEFLIFDFRVFSIFFSFCSLVFFVKGMPRTQECNFHEALHSLRPENTSLVSIVERRDAHFQFSIIIILAWTTFSLPLLRYSI